MKRDSLATLALPLVAIVCCLGFPILASVGAGATIVGLGLGVPLALVAVGVAWIAVRRHRRSRRSPMAPSAPGTTPESASRLSTRG